MFQQVRQQRLENMAIELAAALKRGKPCAVCGSPSHPAPAQPMLGGVDATDEEDAAREEQSALNRRNEAERACHEAELRIQQCWETLGSDEPAAALAEYNAALTLARTRSQRQNEFVGLEAKTRDLGAEKAKVEQDLVGLRTEHSSLRHRRGTARRPSRRGPRRPRGRPDPPRPPAPPRQGPRRPRRPPGRPRRRPVPRHRTTGPGRRPSPPKQASRTCPTALSAARPAIKLQALDDRIAAWERAPHHRPSTLEELAGVDPATEVDLADVDRQGLLGPRRRLRGRHHPEPRPRRLRAGRANWPPACRAERTSLDPLEATYAELDALTDVINGRGQNSKKMTLRSYVLAARLEEVAVAASRPAATDEPGPLQLRPLRLRGRPRHSRRPEPRRPRRLLRPRTPRQDAVRRRVLPRVACPWP